MRFGRAFMARAALTPFANRFWRRLCLLSSAAALIGLLTAVPFAAAPSAAARSGVLAHRTAGPAQDTAPATLIYQGNLDGTAPYSDPGLFVADPAQQASLADLEQQAVTNTLSDHELPSTDALAAQTWGRDTSIAGLWELLVQAIKTPPSSRTTDQANAVAWFQHAADLQLLQEAQEGGLEYAKYLGYSAQAYWNEIDSNPSESNLENFLSGQSTAYCSYHSPAGYTADPYQVPDTCLPYGCPPQDPVSCQPPPPAEQQFVEWGDYDVLGPLYSDPNFTQVSANVAEAVTIGAGVAGGAIAGLAAAAISSSVGFASTVFSAGASAAAAASSIADFAAAAAVSVTAASIGATVGIAIAAAAVMAVAIYELVTTLELPGQLATAITSPPSADLASDLSDQTKADNLYNLFIASTLPQPVNGVEAVTCDQIISPSYAPCLNPPALPSTNTDNLVTQTPSGGTATASDTFSWYDQATKTTNTARVNGGWFVVTSTDASDNTTTFQNLYIQYTAWNGNEYRAYLYPSGDGGYAFFTIQMATGGGNAYQDNANCVKDATCQEQSVIDVDDQKGDGSTVSITFGHGQPSVASGLLGGPNMTVGANPAEGQVNKALTLTATLSQPQVTTGGTPDGTVEFDEYTGGVYYTLCSSVAVSGFATASCNWTPSTAGSDVIFATYTPTAGNDSAGVQTSGLVQVGTLTPTSTVLVPSASSMTATQPITYTATVSDAYSGVPAPTGTVSFTTGSTTLCEAVPLSASGTTYTAACATSLPTAGVDQVVATYNGAAATDPSSANVTTTVNPGTPAIRVSVPSVVLSGEPVPITVGISSAGISNAAFNGLPITVAVDGTTLCTPTLAQPTNSGSSPIIGWYDVATCAAGSSGVAALSAGNHTLTTTFTGPSCLMDGLYGLPPCPPVDNVSGQGHLNITAYAPSVSVSVTGAARGVRRQHPVDAELRIYGHRSAGRHAERSAHLPAELLGDSPRHASGWDLHDQRRHVFGTLGRPLLAGLGDHRDLHRRGQRLRGQSEQGERLHRERDGNADLRLRRHVRVYGRQLPAGTTTSGLSGTVTCTTVDGGVAIKPTLNPGTYGIDANHCSGLTANPSALIEYVGAALVVSPEPVTITVTGTQTYGHYPSFAYTTSPSTGLAGSVTCSTVNGGSPITTVLNVDTFYTLDPSSCSGLYVGNGDYQLIYTGGALSIDPLPVTVTPTGSQIYGGTPSFSYTTSPPVPLLGEVTCTKVGTGATITPTLYPDVFGGLNGCSGLWSQDDDYQIMWANGDAAQFTVFQNPVTAGVTGGLTIGGTPVFTYTTDEATPGLVEFPLLHDRRRRGGDLGSRRGHLHHRRQQLQWPEQHEQR